MDSKTLLLDIETSPVLGWSWQFYDTNLVDVMRDWSILCYGYKWEGGEVDVRMIKRPKSLWDFISHPDNDLKLVKELWTLLDRADEVVAHNGKSFDVKKIRSRFMHFGMPPTSPFRVIDTKLETKRLANNTRNNLDVLLKHWGVGAKVENEGWPMWLKFMSGDPIAYDEMGIYNRGDIVGLDSALKHLGPWIKDRHPRFDGTCDCGSDRFQKRGPVAVGGSTYQLYRCSQCGKSRRSGKALQTIKYRNL